MAIRIHPGTVCLDTLFGLRMPAIVAEPDQKHDAHVGEQLSDTCRFSDQTPADMLLPADGLIHDRDRLYELLRVVRSRFSRSRDLCCCSITTIAS